MWPRLRIDDVRAIVHYLGTLTIVVGASMLVPLAVAIACREWDAAVAFVASFGVTLTAGAALRLVKPRRPGLSRVQALVITGLAWVVGSLVAALPLFLFGATSGSYFDAVFDAAAYLTGAGMSILAHVGTMPVSMVLWRSVAVIIGAQGIVVVALGLGTISRFSGAGALFEAEAHSDRIMPQMAATARFIVAFMGMLIVFGTGACFAVLTLSCGLSPSTALLHAFVLATSAVATGGITPEPAGISYYHSPLLNAVLCVLMMFGVFSFALYFYMAKKGPREFFRDIETRTILVWTVVILILLATAFAHDEYFASVATFLDKGVFNLVSAATNAGFSTLNPSQMGAVAGPGILFALIMGMSMGGATSSTTGGFKAIRLALAIKTIASDIRRSLLPRRARDVIRYRHLGDQVLTPDLSRNVMIVILLYLLSYTMGTVVGVAYGYNPISAAFESVSCAATCGLSVGIVSASMPLGLKVCYFVQMLTGRLEFLTLLTTIASIVGSSLSVARKSPAARAVAGAVPASVRRAWRGEGGRRNGR